MKDEIVPVTHMIKLHEKAINAIFKEKVNI